MPGDLALLLGAPALVAAGRRALPPLADRVLLADVARKHPGYFAPVAETPGFGEALFRLVRELRGAGYDLSDLGPLLDGATDAPEKAGSLAEILSDVRGSGAPASTAPTTRCWPPSPTRLDGLALLVWGMLDLPPALERAAASASPSGCRSTCTSPTSPPRQDAPLAELRRRLVERGASERRVAEPRRRRIGAGRGSGGRCSRRRPSRRSRPTGRCGWCRRRTRRARCGRRRAPACSGRARACRSGTWRSPTGTARRTCRWPRRCSSRPGSRCTCTRARRWPSGRSAARRSGCSALFDSDLSRQSVMDFLTDAKFPERAARGVRRDPGRRAGTRSRARRGSSAAPSSGSDGSRAVQAERRRRDDDLPDWVRSGRRTPAGSRGSSPSSTAGCGDRPARATWAEHLDYLQALLARYVEGADEVIVALRGLERFTALEARGRLRLVPRRRAAGDRDAALRGRDRQPAGRVRRARREHRGGQLAGRDRVRARVDPRRDRAGVPAARAPGPDPARRRARDDLASGRGRRSRRASARGSEEALIFALACEAARERLVVSYARRATGESRPRLPSVFFRELASQLEGERVSAERRAAAAPRRRRADPRRRDRRADPARRTRTTRRRSARPRRARCPSPSATAPICRRASPGRSRSRRSSGRSRRSPARSRRSGAAFADRYSAWDGALGPDALAAIAALMPADAPLVADLARELRDAARSGSCSSGCCASGRSRSPSRSCGSTRSAAAA